MPDLRADQIVYRFTDFELLPVERILLKDGVRVALTPRMFDLLVVLVEAEGHLLSKETLLGRVWADAAVEEGNLNRTVSALRKALGEKKGELKFIETVPKTGYRFVADVERRNGVASTPNAETASSAEPVAADAIAPKAPAPPQAKRASVFPYLLAAGAILLLAGVLGAAFLYYPRSGPAPTERPEEPAMVRLTTNGFDEDQAVWTYDDKIRFLRFTAVNRVESMVMNSDGSDQRRSGSEIRGFRAGTWSPDGKRVIFAKEGEMGVSYLANSDGSDERRLGFTPGPFDWSPDASKVVYSARFPANPDNVEIAIYAVETDEHINITNSPSFDVNPSFSPDGQHVIFNSDRDGNDEIYMMNADGSGLRRLTSDPAREAFQSFSPDGTQIVFNSNRENEKVGIYLLNVNDDSPPVKLSDTKFNSEIRPGCWSRDGSKIVFTSDTGGEKFNIYTMAVEPSKPQIVVGDSEEIRGASVSPDGSRIALAVRTAAGGGELRVMEVASARSRVLTTAENIDLSPAWSPDGRAIAFAMKHSGDTEIFTINADGSGLKNVTNDDARDGSPAWSPDGSKIVFSSDRETRFGRMNLYFANAGDGGDRQVVSGVKFSMTPTWSPDGKLIAYAGDRADGTSQALDIFVTAVGDPASERIVVRRRFHDSNPSFSPDGRRIAFASQSDGNLEIYVVNLDGSGLLRLTRNAADDTMPQFSSDGSKIYFVSNRSGKFSLYAMDSTPK